MARGMISPQAVFFDWDGTLVDSLPMLFRSHNHVRDSFGLPLWSLEEYKQQMYRSSLDLYPEIYGDRSEEALSCLYDFFAENHLDHLAVIKGAKDCLKTLSSQSIPMGLVSNKKHPYLLKETQHLGWDVFFQSIIGAGHARKDKPHPTPLLDAFKASGIKPCKDTVWYVGDTRTDIETARNAGCKSVLITQGEDKQDLIEQYKPDVVFETLDDMVNAAVQKSKKKAC